MFYLLYLISIVARLIPHPPNFTPSGAILIFAASKLGSKKALALAILAAVTCDIFLGFSFASPFVYLGLIGYVYAGRLIKRGVGGYVGAPVAGSIFFFVISNLGVWLGPWYEKSLSGLLSCFVVAIPFYRNTLVGDLFFTAAIFAAAWLAQKIIHPKLKEVKWFKRLERVNLRRRS